MTPYKYLHAINSPEDLRRLPEAALRDVAAEVREYLIDVITQVGGHFGAGLGVVELTVALHYVFDTPRDRIIFDTGHQGYPHKILTGRRDLLPTIRQLGGISGFLRRSESPYDVFGAGHASTSISAALGIAIARDLKGENFKVVAVIGDGAMTCGLAYEAMNNCGVQKRDIIVVLNDNNMSIAPNVWAVSNYFTEVFTTPLAIKLREHFKQLATQAGPIGDRIRFLAGRIEDGFKAVLTPGMLFESLGFKYFGPINGHNIAQLVRILRHIKDIRGPILLHVRTQKGKGYKPAEQDKQFLHAIGKIDKITGKSIVSPSAAPAPPPYQKVFGEALKEIMRQNPRVVGITAAMPDGTGLDIVQKEFPDRVFDVGIAEGHAVTSAAGMATEGIIPVCAIYSTFLQRAFDMIVHDVALQKLHVVFALDRAGVVGADGPTHHGVLDLAYMRIIPGAVVLVPKDEQELRDMLYSAIYAYTNGPVSLRYPRGNGIGVQLRPMQVLPLGKGELLRDGSDVALVCVGPVVYRALRAAEILEQHYGIKAAVVNARFVKPLDEELLCSIAEKTRHVITIEDGQAHGGFGSAVAELYAEKQLTNIRLKIHGIGDHFVEHGTQEQLYQLLKLDSEGIVQITMDFLSSAHLANMSRELSPQSCR
ncbi:MAG: 1-deoxy-D-xylulose-5-phosphate synthase [Bacteroidota bacterium]|nr:1-deoxy-D-xylulose-5-phosphate synthase [Candidatus Kapabacteria bacterium]MDW8074618.1 1-deoxy-D-xylulose-5-phosphate synthase [Bacteroidota bacterium]